MKPAPANPVRVAAVAMVVAAETVEVAAADMAGAAAVAAADTAEEEAAEATTEAATDPRNNNPGIPFQSRSSADLSAVADPLGGSFGIESSETFPFGNRIPESRQAVVENSGI